MTTITKLTYARPMTVRQVITGDMVRLADRLNAALYLTGSQFYAGHGRDHDWRMVVPDLGAALGQLAALGVPGASGLLPHISQWKPNTLGLKFSRHGELVSLQLHSPEFIRALCFFEPVTAEVLRNTPTVRANEVFGVEESYVTEQPHCRLSPRAWLVSIDQNPLQHGEFATQIYHNMILASRTVRNAHGYAWMRQELLREVEAELDQCHPELDLHAGVMRFLWRNQERWSPALRSHVVEEVRAASMHVGLEKLRKSKV